MAALFLLPLQLIQTTINNRVPYAKVALKGTIACASVSGLWSILSSVSSLNVFPSTEFISSYHGADIYDGISCWDSNSVTEQCNNMAQSMVHLLAVENHPQWDCRGLIGSGVNLSTDYRFSFFSFFVTAVVFTILSSFFSVVHDCAVIYFHEQKNIDNLHFWPSGPMPKKEKVISRHPRFNSMCCDLQRRYCRFENMGKMKCCLSICLFPILLLLIIVITIPLIVCLFVLFLFYQFLCIPLCRCKPFGKGLIEMSAFWVGIARTVVVIIALVFCILAITMLSFSIDSSSLQNELDNNNCQCFCNYALRPFDALKFLFVSFLLVIGNVKFIKTWKDETGPQRVYLYLFSYSVPTVKLDVLHHTELVSDTLVNDLNEEFQPNDGRKSQNDTVYTSISVEEEVTVGDESNDDDDDGNDDDQNDIDDDGDGDDHDNDDSEDENDDNNNSIISNEQNHYIEYNEDDKEEKIQSDPINTDENEKNSISYQLRLGLYGLSLFYSAVYICLALSFFAHFRMVPFWKWPEWTMYIIDTMSVLAMAICFYFWFMWIRSLRANDGETDAVTPVSENIGSDDDDDDEDDDDEDDDKTETNSRSGTCALIEGSGYSGSCTMEEKQCFVEIDGGMEDEHHIEQMEV